MSHQFFIMLTFSPCEKLKTHSKTTSPGEGAIVARQQSLKKKSNTTIPVKRKYMYKNNLESFFGVCPSGNDGRCSHERVRSMPTAGPGCSLGQTCVPHNRKPDLDAALHHDNDMACLMVDTLDGINQCVHAISPQSTAGFPRQAAEPLSVR
jgi:hypothetical protein